MNENGTNVDSARVNGSNGQLPPSGLSLDDVYYTLFRHKWLLLGSVCLGIAAALIVPSVRPPRYESQAKVMLKYVLDTPAVSPGTAQAVRSPDSGGLTIMNSEMEILGSADVAEKAAELVGPERILARAGGGSDRSAAADVIRDGLRVEAPARTTVIKVSFRHRDPTVVQAVLQAVLDTYNQKHREVHTGYGVLDEYYVQQRDDLRDKITTTEEELKVLKTQAKVLSSIKDAKQTYHTQIERLTGELLTAETELAVARAVVGNMVSLDPNTNEPPATPASAEKLKEYNELLEQLDAARRRERELLLQSQFTAEHPSVQAIRQVLDRLIAQKSAMEAQDTSLASLHGFVAERGTNRAVVDLTTEVANIKRLTAKVDTLATLLSNVQNRAASVMNLEPQIAQLERQLEQYEKDYRHFQATIDRARQGESAGAGKQVNMSIVQHPTPPGLDRRKLMKLMGGAFAGCVGMGLALAFLIDFVLDRTIRRSGDVRRHMRLSLLLSIPDTSRGSAFRWLSLRRQKAAASKAGPGDKARANGVAPWDEEHHLRAYTDGLRERLITYFEINNVTHSPKLVGVTGCNKGSGVSTLASGLAAALSKIGSGNVLLVDMNVGEGEAHAFHSGKPGCALANIATPESQPEGTASENLYLAPSRLGVDNKLAKVMPAGFTNLVTNLKASDYDYIIFDMPPVTPTSATPRLGSYMDMILFVAESGKTPQQLARQAGALLSEARANAAVVLNKCRRHVPQLLSHET